MLFTHVSLNYSLASILFCTGSIYSLVPLYKLYCRKTGFSGSSISNACPLSPNSERKIKIKFISNTDKNIPWEFKPLQNSLTVRVGTGNLAFYTATNKAYYNTKGIATYNIIPNRAAAYFNKIQCFCFEEQNLDAKESINMPIYFYIDESFVDDLSLKNLEEIILSYTFFGQN
jgi:cytochrome c oxidase assembly protein subunit 11